MKKDNEGKKELAIPSEHLAVFNAIANSSEKYVTRNMILAQLDKKSDYTRKLTEIIHDLVVVYSLPVGSSSRRETKGYFIIENETDLFLAMRDMSSRLGTIKRREEALKKIKFRKDNYK